MDVGCGGRTEERESGGVVTHLAQPNRAGMKEVEAAPMTSRPSMSVPVCCLTERLKKLSTILIMARGSHTLFMLAYVSTSSIARSLNLRRVRGFTLRPEKAHTNRA